MEPKSTYSNENQNTKNDISGNNLTAAIAVMAVIVLLLIAFF